MIFISFLLILTRLCVAGAEVQSSYMHIRQPQDDGPSFKEADNRTSAKSIAGSAIILLLLVLVSIFILDCKRYKDHLSMMVDNLRPASPRINAIDG